MICQWPHRGASINETIPRGQLADAVLELCLHFRLLLLNPHCCRNIWCRLTSPCLTWFGRPPKSFCTDGWISFSLSFFCSKSCRKVLRTQQFSKWFVSTVGNSEIERGHRVKAEGRAGWSQRFVTAMTARSHTGVHLCWGRERVKENEFPTYPTNPLHETLFSKGTWEHFCHFPCN